MQIGVNIGIFTAALLGKILEQVELGATWILHCSFVCCILSVAAQISSVVTIVHDIISTGTFMEWRGLAVFGAVTVVIYFGFTHFIPDSPVWLIMCGRDDDARQSLRRLRGKNYCVEYELQQIISAKANQ